MWAKFISVWVVFVVFCLRDSKPQEVFEVVFNCEFGDHGINVFFGYTCIVENLEFDFSNPFYYIRVEGEHATGRINDDVVNLVILNSSIEIIPANAFQVFPNLIAIEASGSGVQRIPASSLSFANNLEGLFFFGNNIPALNFSPFFARSSVTHINLFANNIESVAPAFFVGLTALRYLVLSGNNLQTLPSEILFPLVNLRTFYASSNSLETIPGRFFERNTQLESIGLEYNNLNAIGAGLVEGLINLEYLGLSGNECVDTYFEFTDLPDTDLVNEALQQCIDNMIPEPPRRRMLTFELRGNMTLFNEYREQLLSVEGRQW